jgi:hypothetical protein
MILALEYKKLKRTALLPALLLGGILSSSLPVINLLARADSFVNLPNKPLEILVSANWLMMAVLNSFLVVLAACILYSIEFSNNAIQRMDTLPIQPGSLFISKFILLTLAFIAVFIIEGTTLYFCAWKWFSITNGFFLELLKLMAYCLLLSLPMLSFMTAISSFCKNMWITLGIGVIGMFAAYFPSVIIASKRCNYKFMVDPIYVSKIFCFLFILSIPMCAVYWLISVLLKNPVASIGIGLVTVVPVVLAINTKAWFALSNVLSNDDGHTADAQIGNQNGDLPI